MRVHCPHCNAELLQTKNPDGPNFCYTCQRLFYVPAERKLPPWILGALVVLVQNWQIMTINR
jgi:hypothetical protein